ncbi:hypothetical protein D3C86_810500 [compost metagenome]
MALLEGVGGGEVVVLAGVDDDVGRSADQAREVLVAERPEDVDVPEEDPVHGVVEQHVEPFLGRQRRDLGHAEAGSVVGELDVAAQLFADLVEGFAHQLEVGAGGVGAARALGGFTVGDEVDQRLAGGADDGDDVRSGARGGDGLGNVLVDVAGGDDQVPPGLGALAEALAGGLAFPALGQEIVEQASGGLVGPGRDFALGDGGVEVDLAFGEGDRRVLDGLARRQGGMREPVRGSARKLVLGGEGIDHPVRPGDAGVVHPVHAIEPKRGALGGERRMAAEIFKHRLGDALSEFAPVGDLRGIDRNMHRQGPLYGWGCVDGVPRHRGMSTGKGFTPKLHYRTFRARKSLWNALRAMDGGIRPLCRKGR